MRSWVNLLILGAVAMAAASCTSPSGPLANNAVLGKADLQYYWQCKVPLENAESIDQIYKLDENLYALTDRNRLICLDAMRGMMKWSYVVAEIGEKVYRPCQADRATLSPKVPGIAEMLTNSPDKSSRVTFKPVVINTLNRFVVLDRDTGEVMREVPLAGVASTGGATDGTYFWVGTTRGWCSCYLLQEGVLAWSMGTDSMLAASPAAFGPRVFLGGTDGSVRAAMAGHDFRAAWQRPIGGAVHAPLAVTDKACLVPCDDNRLYGFAPSTGLELWKQPFICRGPLRDPPQAGAATIFQYAKGDRFYAVNLVSGQKRWDSDSARAVLALIEKQVYLLDRHNNLQVVDEILGTVKTTLPMSGYDRYAANTVTPAIFIGSHDGHMACIRLISAGYLRPEDMTGPPKL
jgi:outer membrane protein assembly factor BamB